MLNRVETGLLLVDVQGKLARLVKDSDHLVASLSALIQGAQQLSLPVVWLEQSPDKLGATIPELHSLLVPKYSPIAKTRFNAMACQEVERSIRQAGCQQWLVCGIEAHICVYQSTVGLLEKGYKAEVVVDAISSRTLANKELAVHKLSVLGAGLTSVEMCRYELVGDASLAEFKAILPLIK